jgi:hypothetical protein
MPTLRHKPFHLQHPPMDRFLINDESKFARVELGGPLGGYVHVYAAAQREDINLVAEIMPKEPINLVVIPTPWSTSPLRIPRRRHHAQFSTVFLFPCHIWILSTVI